MKISRKKSVETIKDNYGDLIEEVKKSFRYDNKTKVVGEDVNVNFLFHSLLGFPRADSFSKANIVVFTGGSDINPNLYGENPHSTVTHINRERDAKEFLLYKSLPDTTLKIGICRGAQLLNVLNGGKLFQNVDRHGNDHHLLDLLTGEVTKVTSTHHQQMIPNFEAWNYNPVAVACDEKGNGYTLCSLKQKAKFSAIGLRASGGKQIDALSVVWDATEYYLTDFEALYYEDSHSFCFQPHPEYLDYEIGQSTCEYFLKQMLELTRDNPFSATFTKTKEKVSFPPSEHTQH